MCIPQPGDMDSAAGSDAGVEQPSSGSSGDPCDLAALAGPRLAAAALATPTLVEPTGCTGSFGYMVNSLATTAGAAAGG